MGLNVLCSVALALSTPKLGAQLPGGSEGGAASSPRPPRPASGAPLRRQTVIPAALSCGLGALAGSAGAASALDLSTPLSALQQQERTVEVRRSHSNSQCTPLTQRRTTLFPRTARALSRQTH